MGRGPTRLLDTGLAKRLSSKGHDVTVVVLDHESGQLTPEPATMLGLNRRLSEEVGRCTRDGAFPIVLAGSCYTCLGTVAGLGPSATGVVWFDTHGDYNTPETSGSGFLDGMALAMLTGRCWKALTGSLPGFEPVPESRVCLVGTRDVDPLEQELIDGGEVEQVPADDVDSGLGPVLDRFRESVTGVYLHLDLDVLDPSVGMANEMAAPGGLTVAQAVGAIAAIGRASPVKAVAVTAYDPACDHIGSVARAAFRLLDAVLASASTGAEPRGAEAGRRRIAAP